MFPKLLAGFGIETPDVIDFVDVAHRVEPAVRDGHRGPTDADAVVLPKFGGTFFGPGFNRFFGNSIAIRTAPLWPILCAG
jgi:hypothetical protein